MKLVAFKKLDGKDEYKFSIDPWNFGIHVLYSEPSVAMENLLQDLPWIQKM